MNVTILNFILIISDTMANQLYQLKAAKCPTDALTFTNCAVVNEKDIDTRRVR